MRKFNLIAFIISTLLIGILTVTSFLAEMAFRGDANDPIIVSLLAPLFSILRFPTHALFNFGRGGGDDLYWIGLLINSVFYGICIERVISYLKRKPKTRPVTTDK